MFLVHSGVLDALIGVGVVAIDTSMMVVSRSKMPTVGLMMMPISP